MADDLFIDGIIFGERNFGGVARTWKEIILGLQSVHFPFVLLMPVRNNISSASSFIDDFRLRSDFFYWPKRFFDRIELRSKLLTSLHGASNFKMFHSTYFTTIDSARTLKFVTVHDMIYEVFETQAPSRWTKHVLHNKRRSIENADQIICVSENTKRDLTIFFPSIAEEKISVIYPGISRLEQGDSMPLLSDIEEKYGVQISGKGYFLLIGRLDGYKNSKILIDLLNHYPNARNFKFLSVGSEKTSDIRDIANRNFPNNFTFIDFSTDQELSVLYRNAIGLVYPSRYEGFGLPVIEAMANSCPVACSTSSSLPEAGGSAAFYFDPQSESDLYQSLIRLINCDREQILAKCTAQANKFTWQNTVSELVRLYNRVS